ncbi:MAG: 16S rRNA (cytosine(967)-C(5))-methyltransferase, partial [Cycloclasticus sp.]|nr:16S rRNA (cytosine(967)-C(5))-methyltransferase [Cycloclasticus sp.]
MSSNTPSSSLSARQTAVSIICSVHQHGKSLTEALKLGENLDPRDRAFCSELCYGTIRWFDRLEAILNFLLKKPFKPKDIDITVLALVGLYQIIYLNTPDHAAVSETINASKKGKKSWAKGVLNGVLRRFLREREHIEHVVDEELNQKFSHPQWLINSIEKDWGDELCNILEANNQRPPMSIRVNQDKITREDYLHQLQESQIETTNHPFNKVGLTLKQ